MNSLDVLMDLRFKEYRVYYWEKFRKILEAEEVLA
jgi:hypothetical protein